MNMNKFSLINKSRNSKNSLMTHKSMKNLLTHSLQVFGRMSMSRKVFFASYLVDAVKNSLKVVEADSEENLTFCCVEILQLLRVSFCNMFIRSLLEESTPLEREVQL